MPNLHDTAKLPAYYHASIAQFLATSDEAVVGTLTSASQFPVDLAQRNAWLEEIRVLRRSLSGLDGHLLLEYDVPRIGSRIDAVVISKGALLPIEFKCGASQFHTADVYQAWDYALDLKNFHSASHSLDIFPVLVATEANSTEVYWGVPAGDGVFPPLRVNANGLQGAIQSAIGRASGPPIEAHAWRTAGYQPSPTIIEAAKALYARHSVEDISRSDAGAQNLLVTAKSVERIIEETQKNKSKSVVFVTGVPGAGKTLVGLNIATQHRRVEQPTHAVFLSGNGPLVAVLQEALTRDEVGRRRATGETVRVGAIRQAVKPFIQNVHHFRDAGIADSVNPPADHVVIFDEAQRAWNEQKATDFMKRKKGVPDFNQSEARFLLSYMDRHKDWAVVVCLVGGGQEIHTGEAGIGSWLDAVRDHFPKWQLFVSPNLKDSEYAAGEALQSVSKHSELNLDESLHLSVSMRSFRSEAVSQFVKCLLDRDVTSARNTLAVVSPRYPIAITRDLRTAQRWVRTKARGSERYGLVASSQALRLKPHAIDVRVEINPVHWFLGPREDTRSSFYLEDAATEFQVQGLELDWVCVTWDADLRTSEGEWRFHDFHGEKWRNIQAEERKQYLLNAYRVLLTRARQGMVIFVPLGDAEDPTRPSKFYDETFEYLLSLGIQELPAA
jgi:hypothetical protein